MKRFSDSDELSVDSVALDNTKTISRNSEQRHDDKRHLGQEYQSYIPHGENEEDRSITREETSLRRSGERNTDTSFQLPMDLNQASHIDSLLPLGWTSPHRTNSSKAPTTPGHDDSHHLVHGAISSSALLSSAGTTYSRRSHSLSSPRFGPHSLTQSQTCGQSRDDVHHNNDPPVTPSPHSPPRSIHSYPQPTISFPYRQPAAFSYPRDRVKSRVPESSFSLHTPCVAVESSPSAANMCPFGTFHSTGELLSSPNQNSNYYTSCYNSFPPQAFRQQTLHSSPPPPTAFQPHLEPSLLYESDYPLSRRLSPSPFPTCDDAPFFDAYFRYGHQVCNPEGESLHQSSMFNNLPTVVHIPVFRVKKRILMKRQRQGCCGYLNLCQCCNKPEGTCALLNCWGCLDREITTKLYPDGRTKSKVHSVILPCFS